MLRIEAPDVISATALHERLRPLGAELRSADGTAQEISIPLPTRRQHAIADVLKIVQEWVDTYDVDEATLALGRRTFTLRSRRLDWIDL